MPIINRKDRRRAQSSESPVVDGDIVSKGIRRCRCFDMNSRSKCGPGTGELRTLLAYLVLMLSSIAWILVLLKS